MNIAGLRIRITFQKNEPYEDEDGNHINTWSDYYTCWATAVTSGLSAAERDAAAVTLDNDRLDITVRYSSETAAIDSTHYRILLKGRVYNIVSISEMGYKNQSRLFQAVLDHTQEASNGEDNSG